MSLLEDNLDKLAALFPNVITEVRGENGKLKRAVNFEMLKLMFSPDDIADGREYYSFTWSGKRDAVTEAGRPTDKVLRPCIEESKNFETTHNLYIEGENLEVLKIIQRAYMNKIKFIYIDPPYNTGHDFVYYNDDYSHDQKEDIQQFQLFDDEGEKNFSSENYGENVKSNPRFHSYWCSMIYPRLVIARNILTDDGVIFISIDDSEQSNVKKICDEIFGEDNFVAQLIWQNKKGGGNDATHIAIEHEYILVYAKNISALGELYESYKEEYVQRYKEEDEEGKFFWDTFKRKAGKQYYPITCPDGTILQYDDDGNPISWLRSQPRFESDIQKGDIRFVKINENWSVQFKQRMPQGKTPRSILIDRGTTSTGAKVLYEIFRRNIFPNPKPVELMTSLLEFATNNDSIVLDFFSGSATTAHAVMNLNHEDGGNRKFIMVQIQEPCNPKSEAAKAGFTNICEIGKERIRRAGENLKGDTGFRVLKLASSNMRDVYIQPESLTRLILDDLIENIKPDRTGIDLLFECITRFGMPLSLAYKSENVNGFTVHTYGDNLITACFDAHINEELIKNMAKRKSQRAVFRDSCFENAAVKINLEQIFRFYAPHTEIKVL